MEQLIAKYVLSEVGFGGLLLLVLIGAFWKLHTDLAKLRVQMAQQMNRDLLAKRYAAYGDLWSRMRTTAVYTASGFGPEEARAYSESMSDWYFLPNGGLFLTRRAREFYFALQDLVQSVGRLPGWRCSERPEKPAEVFAELMTRLSRNDRTVKRVTRLLKKPDKLDPDEWRSACTTVAKTLEALVRESASDAGQVIYAATQQVSSVLRANLAHEVRSRLDIDWPAA